FTARTGRLRYGGSDVAAQYNGSDTASATTIHLRRSSWAVPSVPLYLRRLLLFEWLEPGVLHELRPAIALLDEPFAELGGAHQEGHGGLAHELLLDVR